MDYPTDLPILSFDSAISWREWLDANHVESDGVWLKIAKVASGLQSVNYDQAVDEALCYGWIDGQKRAYDETHWIQRFTPRRARSIWSRVNTKKIERLKASKRMHPSGLAQVEAAKVDGRWDAAYESQRTMKVPPDFQAALEANPRANAFFESLNGANRYAMLYRITTAKKPETRNARIAAIIEMLLEHKKLY